MCGEKKRLAACAQTAEGSPPRMRGKAFRPAVIARWHRITPACAGKSCPLPRRTVSVRDHPRVCGEKRPEWKNEVELVGSPPRVRGKDAIQRHPSCGFGITPACAGKRRTDSKTTLSHEDHPRVCGEKLHSLSPQLCVHGSPPRVRGKVDAATLTLKARGITPACAGKRLLPCCFWRLHRDHPRVCGEKRTRQAVWTQCGGSPPRVRGKVVLLLVGWLLSGITPACAGKSVWQRLRPEPARDHPRVCGEKKMERFFSVLLTGSPPRVRGKAASGIHNHAAAGITPACAGKSYTRTCYAYNVRDHPRVCGEKLPITPTMVQTPGSPPRVRGKD